MFIILIWYFFVGAITFVVFLYYNCMQIDWDVGSSAISTEALSGASLLPGDNKDAKQKDAEAAEDLTPIHSSFENGAAQPSSALSPASRSGFTSRIVLTCVLPFLDTLIAV